MISKILWESLLRGIHELIFVKYTSLYSEVSFSLVKGKNITEKIISFQTIILNYVDSLF